jgi:hypothetical protein
MTFELGIEACIGVLHFWKVLQMEEVQVSEIGKAESLEFSWALLTHR